MTVIVAGVALLSGSFPMGRIQPINENPANDTHPIITYVGDDDDDYNDGEEPIFSVHPLLAALQQ